MTDDLAETLGRVESASLEFKRESSDRHAIRESICALGNPDPQFDVDSSTWRVTMRAAR